MEQRTPPPYASTPTPYPGQAVPPPSRVKPWQVLTAIGLGSFLGVVVVCGGGVALTMIYMQQQFTAFNNLITGNYNSSVPNLTYTMTAPANVTQNQPFEIELTLENTGTSPMTLHSLQDYNGLTLVRSDPPWQSKNSDEMFYQMTLSPNQPQVIKLTVESGAIGSQYLNIDANMDPNNYSYAEGFVTVQVDPPGPAPTPTPIQP